MSNNILIPNGFFYNLEADLKDSNFQKLIKSFLSNLKSEVKRFEEDLLKNKKNLKKYIGDKSYIFLPEKLSKESPLGIIDAPWGTGKTFFIEKILQNQIDKKNKSQNTSNRFFKKMIIIDAWKFSNSKDVPLEFTIELANKLFANEDPGPIKTGLIKRFLKKLLPSSISFSLKLGLPGMFSASIYINKNLNKTDKEKNDEKEIENKYKSIITKNNKRILIFVDNLERLGSYSWDLLKTIIKFQEFPFFTIILPLNLNKLSNMSKEKGNTEYPIEKYIDINLYLFKQNYDVFFLKSFGKKESEILNKIFNQEIQNTNLSIREVQQAFNKHKLIDKDFMHVLSVVSKYIWPIESGISAFFVENVLDIIQYLDKLHAMYMLIFASFTKIQEEFNIFDSDSGDPNIIIAINTRIGYADSEVVASNSFIDESYNVEEIEVSNMWDFYNNFDNNLRSIKELCEKALEIFLLFKDGDEESLQKNNSEMKKLNDKLLDREKGLTDYNNDLSIELKKGIDKNIDKEHELTSKIESTKGVIENIKNEIKTCNSKNEALKTRLKENENKMGAVEDFLTFLKNKKDDKYTLHEELLAKEYNNVFLIEDVLSLPLSDINNEENSNQRLVLLKQLDKCILS